MQRSCISPVFSHPWYNIMTVCSLYIHTYIICIDNVFWKTNAAESEYSGIAIDVINRKLYVTDQRNGVIFELPLDIVNVKPRRVYVDPQSKPRGIVIDTINRFIYLYFHTIQYSSIATKTITTIKLIYLHGWNSVWKVRCPVDMHNSVVSSIDLRL